MFKKIFLLLLFVYINYDISYGNMNEVSCGTLSGYDVTSCNQCFVADFRIYPGSGYYTTDYFRNPGLTGNNLYLKPWEFSVSYDNLQQGSLYFQYPTSHEYTDEAKNNYYFSFGSYGNMFKYAPGQGSPLLKQNGSIGISQYNLSADRNKYGLKVSYNITAYNGVPGSPPDLSSPSIHKECAFIGIAFCGDGYIDTNEGEQCDKGIIPGQPGYNANCNSSCQIVTSNPSCTSLTATPSTGNSPLNTSFACTGVGATSYKIDVLSSTGAIINTINSSTGSYNFDTAGSYTARCSINGNITSATCQQPITVNPVGTPICTSLTVTPNSGNSPLTSNFTCTGIGATSYKIDVLSSTGEVINTINSSTGSYIFSTNGTYTARCYINGQTTTPVACQQTITVTNTGPVCSAGVTGTQSSPISSTTPNLCNISGETAINFTSSTSGNTTTYTWNCTNGTTVKTGGNCSANYSISPEPCRAGTTRGVLSYPITSTTPQLCIVPEEVVSSFVSTTQGNTTYYTWMCGGKQGGDCSASYTPSSSGGGGGGGGGGGSCINGGTTGTLTTTINSNNTGLCQTGSGSNFTSNTIGNTTYYNRSCNGYSGGSCNAMYVHSYCGDGIVQRPNTNGFNEECDFGMVSPWPNYCKSDCTYDETTFPGGGSSGSSPSGNITLPNGGEMIFGPIDNVIIGAGMNPYIVHNLGKPYIKNNSGFDLYFDQLCTITKSGTTLSPTSYNSCRNLGTIVPGQKVELSDIPNVVGGNITTGNFGDNTLFTTIKHNNVLYGIDEEAYFVAPLKVRVSKASIATVGGGTSYVGTGTNIADISNVANNYGGLNASEVRNFVGVGVVASGIYYNLSYSNDINDANAINTIKTTGENYNSNINTISSTSGVNSGDTNNISDFESYNGIANVFILKNKNFKIDYNNIFSGTEAKTYIIENGDLIINQNISYNNNIAFVVKGGNIKIANNVTSIDGTYIAIPKDPTTGGKFIGTGGITENRLTVNGSLYGNVNDLVSQRIYVKNSTNQIDVGTVVSFGSKLFTKPAPLLSTFIDEYLKAEKIAK